MQIHLLRHAIAAPRNAGQWADDRERPLTREGRRRMERAARGLRALGVRLDLVLTSPLVRARDTARIVVEAFRPQPSLRGFRPLAPGGGIGGVLAGLASLPRDASVLLVGHEPDLSRLAAALLLEDHGDLAIEFKKGGLCRIDFDGAPRAGAGRLVLHLTPRVMRRLGRA